MTAPCPECGGQLIPRSSGFHACRECGKLVINPQAPTPTPPSGPAPTPSDDTVPASELAPMAEGEVVIPDYYEVMVGWRAWGVKSDLRPGELPLLHSVTYGDHFWTPREALEATCSRRYAGKTGTDTDNHVPGENCSCGLYSAKTREHLQSMRYHYYDAEARGMFHVIGTVNLWGKIIEGSQGWRSQFGYPAELYVPYEAWHLAGPLQEAYGVPVRLDNILKPSDG